MHFTTVFASVATIAATIVNAAPVAKAEPATDISPLDARAVGPNDRPYFAGFNIVYKNAAEAAFDFSSHNYLCPYNYDALLGSYSACDLNKGHGGQAIFLEPFWSSADSPNAFAAKTYIRVYSSTLKNFGSTAISGSDSDKSRMYLETGYNQGQKPLRRVALLRSDTKLTSSSQLPTGYKWFTTDINQGRGGDYLYIIFSN